MMRSSRLLLFASFALLLVSVSSVVVLNHTVSASAAGNNLVANPGFETGNLSSWSCDTGDTVVSSPVHSGSFALQMNPTSGTTGQCTQTISVQPNTTYTLTAFVNGPFSYLGVINGNSTWVTSTSYSQLTVSQTTGASTTSMTIFVHGWYAQGSVLVDDVVLSGPAGSSSPTPSPTATRTPTPTPTQTATPSPTPTQTATPTPSPTPGPCTGGNGGSLPKHLLTGYWQNFNNGATTLRLRDVNSNFD